MSHSEMLVLRLEESPGELIRPSIQHWNASGHGWYHVSINISELGKFIEHGNITCL